MKNILFTLFAIGLAGLAAVAATTAFLNSPGRPASVQAEVLGIGPPAGEDKPAGSAPAETPPASPPASPSASLPGTPPAAPPTPGGAPATPGAATPAGAEEPESDADPYEGIAPEELPPDLQYDADSSVSFPTNI
jgi:hypothetical protein